MQAQRKVAQEAQRDAERERRRAAQLEEDAGKLGSLRAEVRRLRALEDVAGEVETLRCVLLGPSRVLLGPLYCTIPPHE